MGFVNSSHCGVRKYRIPLNAPSNVTARINKASIITYGNIAKKYDAFPELFRKEKMEVIITNILIYTLVFEYYLLTPFDIIANIKIHEPSKQSTKRQLG